MQYVSSPLESILLRRKSPCFVPSLHCNPLSDRDRVYPFLLAVPGTLPFFNKKSDRGDLYAGPRQRKKVSKEATEPHIVFRCFACC